MTALIVGATGRTGSRLVAELLRRGVSVRAIARSPGKLPSEVRDHPQMALIEASVLDLSDEEMADAVRGCDAVVSCLGHVLSLKGMYGAPRDLCTDAARRLVRAIESNAAPRATRFILMSTVGVANPDLDERRPWPARALLTVLRHTVPPHRDNETAAAFLHREVGRDRPHVEWCCVRPDSLTEDDASPYDIVASPTTGLVSGRPTARANVAHFMAELVERDDLWDAWRFRMPVVMDAEPDDASG